MRLHLLILAALLVALSGCSDDDGGGAGDGDDGGDGDGGDGNQTDAPPAVDLTISATGVYPIDFGYDKDTLTAAAGARVNITFTNDDANLFVTHDWVLEGVEGAATQAIAPGESATISFTAPEAGEYAYYCSVPGHRDMGMEGTLTVTGDGDDAGMVG